MQIILARHGEPDLAVWPKISTARMPEWIAAYNRVGVKNDHTFSEINSVIPLNYKCKVASSLPPCFRLVVVSNF
jgi:hypothetical protein